MTTFYKIPVYRKVNGVKTEYIFEFDYKVRGEPNPPGLPQSLHIIWNSYYANEHPIQIHSINGTRVENTFGHLTSLKTYNEGTIITHLIMDKLAYDTDPYVAFWLTGTPIPHYLKDGSIKVCARILPTLVDTSIVNEYYMDTSEFVDFMDENMKTVGYSFTDHFTSWDEFCV
jgi:hypothetical protein